MMKLKDYLPYVIALLAVVAALYAWFRPAPPAQQPEAAPMPKPMIAYRIPMGYVPLEQCQIKAYDKEKASEATKQPEAIAKDKSKQITAIGEVAPWKGKTQVTAIFDTKTESTELYQRRLPPPFFEFLNEKELGFRYGTRMNAYGRWTFLRMGSFHFAGYAQAGENDSVAQIDLSYRW